MTKTIQIVDDSEPLRELLKEFLSLKGFRTIESTNGREALRTIRDESPDLILLDILMPYVDGFQVIDEIKRSNQIPVIVMSSQAMTENFDKADELDVEEYIVKPFSINDLYNTVQTVLDRN